jgi:hypothetical protein
VLADALRRLVATSDEDVKQQITDAEKRTGVERLWSRARGEFLDALNAARCALAPASPPQDNPKDKEGSMETTEKWARRAETAEAALAAALLRAEQAEKERDAAKSSLLQLAKVADAEVDRLTELLTRALASAASPPQDNPPPHGQEPGT